MLTKEDVQKIAALAKLDLSAEECDRYVRELGAILQYVEKLDALDLSKVKATSHAVEVTNVFRADEVKTSTVRDKALSQAPAREDNLFKVPRII